MLNVFRFCTGKHKHEFIDIEWTCEVDINWTCACISQYKTRKRSRFDLLTCYLLFFLFFSSAFFISYSAIGIRSHALTMWSHCKAMSFFLIFNFFLFVSRENSSFSLMSFNKFLANPGNKARILRFCKTT